MFHTNMQLGNLPQKLTQDSTLLQNEKCIIKAAAGTLTLPIMIDNMTRGHIFVGRGQFTLDAIIETARGAVGESIIKDLTQPFIMLGENPKLTQNLTPATTEDLAHYGYASADELLKTANNMLERLAHKRHVHFGTDPDAHIFAFDIGQDKLDILIAKGDRLVYKSEDKVYISKNKAENVAIGQGQIFVARKGKTVVIDKDNIFVDRSGEP